MIGAFASGRASSASPRYRDARRTGRDLRARQAAVTRRRAAPLLAGRHRAPRRLPRGLCLPRRWPGEPLRGRRRMKAGSPRHAALVERIRTRFRAEDGGLYSTSDEHEALLLRPREGHDGATPSANAMAGARPDPALVSPERVGAPRRGRRAVEAFGVTLMQHPVGFATSLLALDFVRPWTRRARPDRRAGRSPNGGPRSFTGEPLCALCRLRPSRPRRRREQPSTPAGQGARGWSPGALRLPGLHLPPPVTDPAEVPRVLSILGHAEMRNPMTARR